MSKNFQRTLKISFSMIFNNFMLASKSEMLFENTLIENRIKSEDSLNFKKRLRKS